MCRSDVCNTLYLRLCTKQAYDFWSLPISVLLALHINTQHVSVRFCAWERLVFIRNIYAFHMLFASFNRDAWWKEKPTKKRRTLSAVTENVTLTSIIPFVCVYCACIRAWRLVCCWRRVGLSIYNTQICAETASGRDRDAVRSRLFACVLCYHILDIIITHTTTYKYIHKPEYPSGVQNIAMVWPQLAYICPTRTNRHIHTQKTLLLPTQIIHRDVIKKRDAQSLTHIYNTYTGDIYC